MNLKQFYYRDYFRNLNFRKSTDTKAQEKIIKENQPLLEVANKKLFGFALRVNNPALAYLNLSSVSQQNIDDETQSKQSHQKYHLIELTTTYPGLIAGIGYRHEFKNEGELKLGFSFDHTTGLPIIPGSSIKGTLRSVFPSFKLRNDDPLLPDLKNASEVQIAKSNFIAELFWKKQDMHQEVHELELAIFEGIDWLKTKAKRKAKPEQDVKEVIDQVDEGLPDKEARPERDVEEIEKVNTVVYLPLKQHDIFLDAYVCGSLYADHYIFGPDSLTPHGLNPLKNPTPLPFLKILPGVQFCFQFLLTDSAGVNASVKQAAFGGILQTIGVGAKTNVGYGQLMTTEDFINTYGNNFDAPVDLRSNSANQSEQEEETPTQAFSIGQECIGAVYRVEVGKTQTQIFFRVAGNTKELKDYVKNEGKTYSVGNTVKVRVDIVKSDYQIDKAKIIE